MHETEGRFTLLCKGEQPIGSDKVFVGFFFDSVENDPQFFGGNISLSDEDESYVSSFQKNVQT